MSVRPKTPTTLWKRWAAISRSHASEEGHGAFGAWDRESGRLLPQTMPTFVGIKIATTMGHPESGGFGVFHVEQSAAG